MGIESFVADTFIYQTLTNDTTLKAGITGVYDTTAVQGATFPYVVFQFQSETPIETFNGIRIYSTVNYLVKVITQDTTFNSIKTLAERIDALLHRAMLIPNSDGLMMWSSRVNEIRISEQGDGGTEYRHLGGVYKIYCQVP